MSKINLNLHINEVNLIIKALSELPFREVYELMGKIHEQSNNQLKNGQAKLAPNNKATSQ